MSLSNAPQRLSPCHCCLATQANQSFIWSCYFAATKQLQSVTKVGAICLAYSERSKKWEVFFFYLLWTECRATLHRVLWSYFQMLTYIWFCSMLVQFAFFFNYEKCILPSKEHIPVKYFPCYPHFPSDQSHFLTFLKQERISCKALLQFSIKHFCTSLYLLWLPFCCFDWKLCFLKGTDYSINLRRDLWDSVLSKAYILQWWRAWTTQLRKHLSREVMAKQ